MTTRADVLDLLRNGENSAVEFKRDDVHPDKIAKAMSALLNSDGGRILLGVEDDGEISGLTQSLDDAEQRIMNIARENLQPPIVPFWSTVTMESGRRIGIVTLPDDSPGKPYRARIGSAWVSFSRVGATSRETTREEEARLWQQAGIVHYEMKPVPQTGLDSLDLSLLDNYFRVVLRRDTPKESEGWTRVLTNLGILDERAGYKATVAGLLLFGRNPNRQLPQAGIIASSFPSRDKDYDMTDEEVIRGPLVSRVSARGRIEEKGVIDRAIDFVRLNVGTRAWLQGGRRRRRRALPPDAVREAIVNAVAHRDYARETTDVEVSLYEDRLEVISPGRLPNGVTVERMKEGMRAARNGLLKDVLRDYRYVEHLGMGVRNRIILAMRRHNGTEPDLVEEEHRFTVRLWKAPRGTREPGRGAESGTGAGS